MDLISGWFWLLNGKRKPPHCVGWVLASISTCPFSSLKAVPYTTFSCISYQLKLGQCVAREEVFFVSLMTRLKQKQGFYIEINHEICHQISVCAQQGSYPNGINNIRVILNLFEDFSGELSFPLGFCTITFF